MRCLAVFSLFLGLAACQETPVVETMSYTCGAEEMSHLTGIQRAQLETIAFSQPYRILGPNDPMTMDFRGDRINFALDESGAVIRIFCG
jgi:Peptidase inhibitor I78 family.